MITRELMAMLVCAAGVIGSLLFGFYFDNLQTTIYSALAAMIFFSVFIYVGLTKF